MRLINYAVSWILQTGANGFATATSNESSDCNIQGMNIVLRGPGNIPLALDGLDVRQDVRSSAEDVNSKQSNVCLIILVSWKT
jgi:hypothetical protein